MRDAAGNINYNRTNVSVMQDTTAPTISEIKVDGYKVTVSASDETALHAEAYSFNGGWTWQKSNSYVSSGSYTWIPGTICVRDAAGNINYNRTNVSVPQDNTPQDKTAPTISEIKVDGYKVTVSASDETALHAEAYSFNGGWTWQKSNSYVSSGSYTWFRARSVCGMPQGTSITTVQM